MKKWKINSPDISITDSLVKTTGLSPFICRLLASRGIVSRDDAEYFFNSNSLSDPFDILDMEKAVNVIGEAVESGEKIAVYGDYDCDGVTATYMLFSYLEALGAEVCWYIPEREEGYGLNIPAIDKLKKEGVSLIVTVDNGISAVEEAKHIAKCGMRLVITDHHQVPDTLPVAEAIVNPHRPDDISEYKNLAGCGVALKLIMAMEGDPDSVLMQYADIAAIGTVGDIVRLDGENRIIVRNGLDYMTRTENMGLLQLLRNCGIEEGSEITSEFLAYSVCPRINAAGRYRSPKTSMELLLCEDMNSAMNKARELSELNSLRQQAEASIIAEAEEQIKNNPDLLNKRILIVKGENWMHGIIGIASTRLLHKYGKPNIVLTVEGKETRGSARSADGLSLYELLDSCADKLIRFGGHTKAAGLTVSTDRTEEFTEAVYAYCDENIKSAVIETLYADMELSPDELSIKNIELIENLEPFGEGNQLPVFLLKNCQIRSKRKLKDGKYVAFNVIFGGAEQKAVFFGSTFDAFAYGEGDIVDILANLTINEYGGKRSINLMVKDIRFSDFRQERYLAAMTAYEDYRCGRVEKRLLPRMAPDNAEMRKGYDILRKTNILSKAELLADREGLNCCKFRIILDIFEEFGLIETDITKNSVKLIPTGNKADLSKSKILAALNNTAQ